MRKNPRDHSTVVLSLRSDLTINCNSHYIGIKVVERILSSECCMFKLSFGLNFPCYSTVRRIFPHHVWHCNSDLGKQTMISASTAGTLRCVTLTCAHNVLCLTWMYVREVFYTVIKAQQEYAEPVRMLTRIKIKPPHSNQYFNWDACSDEPTACHSVFTHFHFKKKNIQFSIQFHLFNETDCLRLPH